MEPIYEKEISLVEAAAKYPAVFAKVCEKFEKTKKNSKRLSSVELNEDNFQCIIGTAGKKYAIKLALRNPSSNPNAVNRWLSLWHDLKTHEFAGNGSGF